MTISVLVDPADIDFRVSVLAETVAALHAAAEPGHHGADPLARELTELVDDDLAAAIHDTAYLWRVSRPDVFLPATGGDHLADELDGVDRLSDEVWVSSVLITSSCGSLAARPDLGSPLDDPRAAETARERAAARGPAAVRFADAALGAPGATRARVRSVIEQFHARVLGGLWPEVGATLTAETRGRRDVLATVGAERTLAGMSGALAVHDHEIRIDKLQDARVGRADVGVTFLPTLLGDPHILVAYAQTVRPVIQYPVRRGPATLDPDLDGVQQRIRALDHPLRLRLLRSLVRGPRSTAELSDSWAVSAPEVSRHLAVLRDAGLITARREGRYVMYTADAVVLQRLGGDLLAGLLR